MCTLFLKTVFSYGKLSRRIFHPLVLDVLFSSRDAFKLPTLFSIANIKSALFYLRIFFFAPTFPWFHVHCTFCSLFHIKAINELSGGIGSKKLLWLGWFKWKSFTFFCNNSLSIHSLLLYGIYTFFSYACNETYGSFQIESNSLAIVEKVEQRDKLLFTFWAPERKYAKQKQQRETQEYRFKFFASENQTVLNSCDNKLRCYLLSNSALSTRN